MVPVPVSLLILWSQVKKQMCFQLHLRNNK
jgi:hypothetical protein